MPYSLAAMFLILVVAIAHSTRADVDKGAQIAGQWCANCHVVGPSPKSAVTDGPPSFQAIARSGMAPDQLRAFLSHPHGEMPDLALTRAEIDDLIGYITTLR